MRKFSSTSYMGQTFRLTGSGFTIAIAAMLTAQPANAGQCLFIGSPQQGVEPPLAVDATCVDPDYNAGTFVVESTTRKSLTLPTKEEIAYTEVKGHFPATHSRDTLMPGATGGPTLAQHGVTWKFPDKAHFSNRFLQNVYPIGGGFVDPAFAFTHGAYIVGVTPGTPSVGYRVDAAAAKLAKEYANKLYGDTGRIYGYIYGVSGGSVQTIGAAEGTTGVWDGALPISIATHSLNVHSFPWDGLYALAVPEAKRKAIAAAAAPESGKDIHEGLTAEETAVLDELLNAGFSRRALENNQFSLAMTTILAGGLPTTDPTYEDDFWTKPGYEGSNPPTYLKAAKVDGFATITAIHRNEAGEPTGVELDPATIPALGTIGDTGLQYYVYAPDATTRYVGPSGGSLVGALKGNIFTITKPVQSGFIPAGPPTDPALLKGLTVGGKIRINNRFLLAVCFYPRHTALNNANPAYKQYRKADGTWKYPQRPVSIAFTSTASTTGGLVESGAVRFKTIIMENTVDPNSYPYVGSFYHSQIRRTLGAAKADQMARIYYNDNADHASFGDIRGTDASMLVGFGGLVHQALLDLANWAEKGVTPAPSTRFTIDPMNQVVLARDVQVRQGLQPVVTLSANGAGYAEVKAGQAVMLSGTITVPPGRGKVMQYDWYLGEKLPVAYEAPVVLAKPQAGVKVSRELSFNTPGSYLVTLRALAQRNGIADPTTSLQNLARVRIVVREGAKGGGKKAAVLENDRNNPVGLSVDSTAIGTLLDNPAAKAILVKNVPELVNNSSFSAWRGLTLRAVQKLVGQSLRDEQLIAIQADLDKLPAK